MSLLLALSVIRGDAPFCPLSDNSGQSQISVGDGLSAFDPKRTFSLSGISDLFLYVLALSTPLVPQWSLFGGSLLKVIHFDQTFEK